jgi:hypothetical protein
MLLFQQQLTAEEQEKRSRRRELNRLAAKRSREKGQRRKDTLIHVSSHCLGVIF